MSLLSPTNLALAGAAIASVVILMKVKNDKAAGGGAKAPKKAGKGAKAGGLSLSSLKRGKGSIGGAKLSKFSRSKGAKGPKAAKSAKSGGGRMRLSRGRKGLPAPAAAGPMEMAMAETGAAASMEAPTMATGHASGMPTPSWAAADAPPAWNASEVITAPGWPVPGGDQGWTPPAMPEQVAEPVMAMAGSAQGEPAPPVTADLAEYDFTDATDVGNQPPAAAAPPADNGWADDDEDFDPTSGWAVPDAPPESMAAVAPAAAPAMEWSMDEDSADGLDGDDPISEWSLPAAPEPQASEWTDGADTATEAPMWEAQEEPSWSLDMDDSTPVVETPAQDLVESVEPISEWSLPDAPEVAHEEASAEWSMDESPLAEIDVPEVPVLEAQAVQTPAAIDWSDESIADHEDDSWAEPVPELATAEPVALASTDNDFDFSTTWDSTDADISTDEPTDELLSAPRRLSGPNPFESWMNLRPGGKLNDDLDLVEDEAASNVLTIPENEWDEEDDASDLRQSGRFSLGGNALEGGHIAVTGVNFREQLTAAGWRDMSDIERSLRIHLQIAATHNCSAQDLIILVDPGFGPDREGFTLRLEAEQAGPFMASGTWHLM